MAQPDTVLVVDDDAQVRAMLHDYLGSHGLQVHLAADGRAARGMLADRPIDVVLLDLAMPGEDGLSLARHIRERYPCGIIMVTASANVVDRIVGLEVGADDYVTKPFDPRELLARIKSVLRRARSAPVEPTEEHGRYTPFGAYKLDVHARRLLDSAGDEVPLTSAEFSLLEVLAARPNRVLSRDQILNLTQQRDWDPYDRSVDIRVARLRRKVEVDPSNPRLIRTVRGVGYMYVPTALGMGKQPA
ncbi:response regulator [Aquisalimonas sp.]|uniref:response regulator n=1 Tax=Aquisalimonas sp. TaxID=1872621 RepID=UPI0025B8F809|nr:response regulator [Aquisalimonas sp.]